MNSTRRLRRRLPSRLESRVSSYTASAAGVLAGAVSIGSSDAAIVYVNANNALLNDPVRNNGASTFWTVDLDNNGAIDFRLRTREEVGTGLASLAYLASPVGGEVDVIGLSAPGPPPNSNINYYYPSRLLNGATIDGSAAFLTLSGSYSGSMAFAGGFPNSQWAVAPNNTGYLGLKFKIGAADHYAWVRLTVLPNNDAADPRAFVVHEYAYENTPDVGIAAGAIPEPSSLGLLALGSIGLSAHRRRRKSSSAA